MFDVNYDYGDICSGYTTVWQTGALMVTQNSRLVSIESYDGNYFYPVWISWLIGFQICGEDFKNGGGFWYCGALLNMARLYMLDKIEDYLVEPLWRHYSW